MSSKSACWTIRSCSRAAASFFGVFARIIARTIGKRSGARNMCSVRHRPMPSAPFPRATFASAPVSHCADSHLPFTDGVGPLQHCLVLGWRLRSSKFKRSNMTSPDVPSIEMTSPCKLLSIRQRMTPRDFDGVSTNDCRRSPTTGHHGRGRQVHSSGEDALGDHHAVHVSGLVSLRTKTTFSPSLLQSQHHQQ